MFIPLKPFFGTGCKAVGPSFLHHYSENVFFLIIISLKIVVQQVGHQSSQQSSDLYLGSLFGYDGIALVHL
jgi:hypothetical protein